MLNCEIVHVQNLARSLAFAVIGFCVNATAANAASVDGGSGEMYVFARPSGAFFLGHVGWGYKTDQSPDRYCAGGIENPGGRAVVASQGDIGYWQRCQLSYDALLQEMRTRGYKDGKWIAVSRSSTFGAASFANDTVRTRGYKAVGLNCANGTWDVAREYGVPTTNLPLLQLFPAPNLWYEALSLRYGWQGGVL